MAAVPKRYLNIWHIYSRHKQPRRPNTNVEIKPKKDVCMDTIFLSECFQSQTNPQEGGMGWSHKTGCSKKGTALIAQENCSEWFWHSFKTKIHLSWIRVWELAKYSWIWVFFCSSYSGGIWDVSSIPVTDWLVPFGANLRAGGHTSHQGAVPDGDLKSSMWRGGGYRRVLLQMHWKRWIPHRRYIDSIFIWELCCGWTH